MFRFIHQHSRPVRDSEGRAFAARIYGEKAPEGTWSGWIIFYPLTRGTILSTDRETTQPNGRALEYWASGLSPTYLEGALQRAIDLQPKSQLARLAARAERDAARALSLAADHQAAAAVALEAAEEAERSRRDAEGLIEELSDDSRRS